MSTFPDGLQVVVYPSLGQEIEGSYATIKSMALSLETNLTPWNVGAGDGGLGDAC